MRPLPLIVVGLGVLVACGSTGTYTPPDPPATGGGGAASSPSLGAGGASSEPALGSGGTSAGPALGQGGGASGPSLTAGQAASSSGASSSSGSGGGGTKTCCAQATDATCTGPTATECSCVQVPASTDCAAEVQSGATLVASCAGFSSCCGTTTSNGMDVCVCVNSAYILCEGGNGATCGSLASANGITPAADCP